MSKPKHSERTDRGEGTPKTVPINWEEGWVKAPEAVLYDSTLSATDFRVYLAILKHGNWEKPKQAAKGCWPGAPSLAKNLGMSERHVRRSIATLVERGLLDMENQSGSSNKYFRTDEFTVEVTPTSETLTPDVDVRGGGHGRQGGVTPVSGDPGHGRHAKKNQEADPREEEPLKNIRPSRGGGDDVDDAEVQFKIPTTVRGLVDYFGEKAEAWNKEKGFPLADRDGNPKALGQHIGRMLKQDGYSPAFMVLVIDGFFTNLEPLRLAKGQKSLWRIFCSPKGSTLSAIKKAEEQCKTRMSREGHLARPPQRYQFNELTHDTKEEALAAYREALAAWEADGGDKDPRLDPMYWADIVVQDKHRRRAA